LFDKIYYYINEKQIDEEDVEDIWVFLHALIKISINYIHEKREPTIVRIAVSNKSPALPRDAVDASEPAMRIIEIPKYQNPNGAFASINLDEQTKLWKIDRQFEIVGHAFPYS
jgi:hypothetical protein